MKTGPWTSGTMAWLATALMGCIAVPAQADERIGSGGMSFINNGTVNLSCTDLFVTGTLNLNQGTYFNVRNVSVLAGGVLNGGTGSLTYSGTFTVAPGGQFNRQQIVLGVNAVCAAAPPIPFAHPVPTLATPMLFALAALMLWLANLAIGNLGVRKRPESQKV
ncbi:MAG: hypothetical protein ABI847_20660 [Anaerolineales bacterium]